MSWRYSAVAVNTTSEEEFRPVSQESWMTPMMKPMPTTCMAMSLVMPNRAQHMGMSSSEPPATPEAPQADTAASTQRMSAVTGSTARLMVWQAAMVITVMVTAAPAMLMVAPNGMDTE